MRQMNYGGITELTPMNPKRRARVMKKQANTTRRSVVPKSAESVPESERWLYRNPEALASVRRGLEDAAAGRTKSIGSFARFAPRRSR
jgi:hypothetical protein